MWANPFKDLLFVDIDYCLYPKEDVTVHYRLLKYKREYVEKLAVSFKWYTRTDKYVEKWM